MVESAAVVGGFASQIGYATSTSRDKLAAVPASQPRKVWTSVRGGNSVRLGQTVLVDLHFKVSRVRSRRCLEVRLPVFICLVIDLF